MKIAPINNNLQQNESNFKGKFLMNYEIRKVVDMADRVELLRFKNMLKAMEKVDDNVFFSVTSLTKPTFYQDGTISGFVSVYNLTKQEGLNRDNKKLIGSYTIDSDRSGANLLSCITDKLRDSYKGLFPSKSRNELKDDIFNLLA